MTEISSLRRPSTASIQEADLKTESRCFNPDILHVFSDEKDAHIRSVLSEDLLPSHNILSSFPQFSRLPIELRYLIWEAALPEPTIIPRTWNSICGYNLHRKVPEVLQVCSESRRLLIASAECIQGPQTPKYELVQRRDQRNEGVFLNWWTDSIWIYRGCKLALLVERLGITNICLDDVTDTEVASYTNLQNLIMTWGLRPCWVESALDEGINFIQKFPQLKLLTLLVDFSEHGWPEPSTLRGLRKLKRNEVKRIWGLIQRAFRKACERDPAWSPPSLHIVHRTANWSREEA